MNPATTSTGIDILMAVHQPDLRFLEKQVESIRRQSHSDWRLFLMLDGDHPALMDRIHEWKHQDTRIECDVLAGHSGCCRTFEAGLSRIKEKADRAAFIALADQDDIWEPRKLETLLESFNGHPEALMVFCDSSIIDENDALVSPSLHMSEERAQDFSLVSLWARNSISGHAQLFRSSLLDICTPFPGKLCDSGLNHDHWLAMAAAHSGSIRFVNEVLVHHRLHDCNQIGPRICKPSSSGGGVSAWRHQNQRLRAALELRHGFLRSLPGFPDQSLGCGLFIFSAVQCLLHGNLPAAFIFLRASLAPAAFVTGPA
ncbi:MAG: glycosyltransferase [Akkermansiaceae bacterium]|jgi:hypothetical protein|nr:glycosyltransferase [Akkermansiaceae bacterium]